MDKNIWSTTIFIKGSFLHQLKRLLFKTNREVNQKNINKILTVAKSILDCCERSFVGSSTWRYQKNVYVQDLWLKNCVSIFLSTLILNSRLYMMLCKKSSFNLNEMTFETLFQVLKIKLSLAIDGCLGTDRIKMK